jgi:hypothetical protein
LVYFAKGLPIEGLGPWLFEEELERGEGLVLISGVFLASLVCRPGCVSILVLVEIDLGLSE